MRSARASGHRLNYFVPFQLLSPILNTVFVYTVFHFQAKLEFLTNGLAVSHSHFIIHHNL